MANSPQLPDMVSSRRLLAVGSCVLLALFLLTGNVVALNDADGDGVDDSDDDCSDTPEGEVADSNGCSESQRSTSGGGEGGSDGSGAGSSGVDSDGDGVSDDEDDCEDTPDTSVNSAGCPDHDTDGVADADDECPNTPHSERREVDDSGCTPFFDETFVESAPLLGRITNANAISFGTVSMVLASLGWAMKAGRMVGLTGGGSSRRKKKFLRRINKAKHSNELEGIRKELNRANEKSKLSDGAFSDLMTALDQRIRTMSSASVNTMELTQKVKMRPSSKPPSN